MVPRKFNIVEFGGFDLAGNYGEALPGIYDKIVDAHWNCVYIMCFGLKFGGFEIAPQYMIPEMFSDHIMLNGIISIGRNDVITIPGIEPSPVEPVILPLTVNEDGVYSVPEGVDGYNPITVSVGGNPPLPSEYQEVEYITFYQAQYVTIGNLNRNLLVQVSASASVRKSDNVVIGYKGSSSASTDFEARFNNGAMNLWARFSEYSSEVFAAYPSGNDLNVVRELIFSLKNYTPAKFFIGRYSASESSAYFGGNFYRAECYTLNQIAGKISEFEIANVFVPCYRKADSTPGIYDLYTSTFYMNEGTGDFTVGPDVN